MPDSTSDKGTTVPSNILSYSFTVCHSVLLCVVGDIESAVKQPAHKIKIISHIFVFCAQSARNAALSGLAFLRSVFTYFRGIGLIFPCIPLTCLSCLQSSNV
jgi:hypothetical protein